MGRKKEDKSNEDFSELIQKIKNHLIEYYEPVNDPAQAEIHFSTYEVYRQLQRIVPNENLYTAADVALWLHNGGFTFWDFGELRFEWLMKKK